MLSLSKSTGYAILALSCLQSCPARWILAKDIAGCTGVPLPYLSKLLHALTGSGLIETKRGYKGGFRLSRPADEINLMMIAEAVDGNAWLPQCLLGLEGCSDARACPTHEFWSAERLRIEQQLRTLTLRDVAEFESQRGTRLCGCDSACGESPTDTPSSSVLRSPRHGHE